MGMEKSEGIMDDESVEFMDRPVVTGVGRLVAGSRSQIRANGPFFFLFLPFNSFPSFTSRRPMITKAR